MEVEKRMLSWDSFETSIANTFRELLKDQKFVDVTLVTVDDEQLRIHKTVLIYQGLILVVNRFGSL